jgi:hypothetical protein
MVSKLVAEVMTQESPKKAGELLEEISEPIAAARE